MINVTLNGRLAGRTWFPILFAAIVGLGAVIYEHVSPGGSPGLMVFLAGGLLFLAMQLHAMWHGRICSARKHNFVVRESVQETLSPEPAHPESDEGAGRASAAAGEPRTLNVASLWTHKAPLIPGIPRLGFRLRGVQFALHRAFLLGRVAGRLHYRLRFLESRGEITALRMAGFEAFPKEKQGSPLLQTGYAAALLGHLSKTWAGADYAIDLEDFQSRGEASNVSGAVAKALDLRYGLLAHTMNDCVRSLADVVVPAYSAERCFRACALIGHIRATSTRDEIGLAELADVDAGRQVLTWEHERGFTYKALAQILRRSTESTSKTKPDSLPGEEVDLKSAFVEVAKTRICAGIVTLHRQRGYGQPSSDYIGEISAMIRTEMEELAAGLEYNLRAKGENPHGRWTERSDASAAAGDFMASRYRRDDRSVLRPDDSPAEESRGRQHQRPVRYDEIQRVQQNQLE